MTFSVIGRSPKGQALAILTHTKRSPRQAVEHANELRRSGMLVTVQDDETGNPVSLDALTVLANSKP